MGSFCGSRSSGTQVAQTSNAPWAAQQPHLTFGFEEARRQFGQPRQFFPGSTVVPFSPQTETGLQAVENRATAGSPVQLGANIENMRTVGGDYLSAGNPYFQDTVGSLYRAIRPNIDAQFSGAGRYGSGAHQQALASAITERAAPLAMQNYESERGRMQQASQFAPQLAAADYADATRLLGVGEAREAMSGQELQDLMTRWQYQQDEPGQRLARYLQMIQGGYGGESTQSEPIYRNRLGGALGGGLAGAQLGNVFGAPQIGAGLGGLLGLFG